MSNLKSEFWLLSRKIKIRFSVYEDDLLFIHSENISSQFKLNKLKVIILYTPMLNMKSVKVGFYIGDSVADYFSFVFSSSEYQGLLTYFRSLGFPCVQSNIDIGV